MPEGDTLRRLADMLASRFQGQQVVSSVFRHPRYATTDFTGTTLESVDSRGKHLLIRFSNGYSIHVHLRMTGAVYPRFAAEVRPHNRKFEIQLSNGWMTAVDIPILGVMKTKDEGRVIGHLGPDICGNYDHELATENLTAAGRIPTTQAMLDQRLVAGFGNIYAVETPFIVGINPHTPVSSLSNAEGLLAIAVALIRTNARRGPQNTTGRKIHLTDHWVLSNSIRQCKVCGAKLRKLSGRETPWKRRTSWCPNCQSPENCTVDLDRATKLLRSHPCRKAVELSTGQLLLPVNERVVTARLRPNEGGLKRSR